MISTPFIAMLHVQHMILYHVFPILRYCTAIILYTRMHFTLNIAMCATCVQPTILKMYPQSEMQLALHQHCFMPQHLCQTQQHMQKSD